MHEIEWHLRILPVGSPTVYQQAEELTVGIHIVRIRFALIPDDTLDRVLLQRQDAALVEIAWLIRMTAQMGGIVGEVLGCSATHPILDKVVLQPVAQDGRKLGFQGVSIYPCLGRCTADGIAYQAHWHLQAVAQHLAVVISHGRELGCRLGGSPLPGGISVILQMVQRIQAGCRPCHIVGFPAAFHVEEAQVGVVGLGDVSLAGGSLVQPECHVRLA